MGWNGIGIGWPNATSGGVIPGPTTESYGIYSCSGGENLASDPYPIGSFIPGYRITIGGSDYGYVTSIIPAAEGDSIGNLPIGNVDSRCNDSEIQLSLVLTPSTSTNYSIRVRGYVYNGGLPVISENNTLFLTITYYIPFTNNEGNYLTSSGNIQTEIPVYNIPIQEQTTLIEIPYFTVPNGYYPEYSELTVTSFSLGNTLLGPYDSGEVYPNRFVTTYGNVWTFYWPIEP
jgi:hypothetical protein